MTYSLIIAGSTAHTALVVAELLNDHRFEIKAIVTPTPKPIGRQQTIIPNPLHELANQQQIPTVLVEHKLDASCQAQLTQIMGGAEAMADFLLVIDFGYYVPGWLLSQAKIKPLNIHPSLLPRWRGSSPGQFVLLSGEEQSAVSVITVAKAMDQGEIWHQHEFAVKPEWHTDAYYDHAFRLIAPLMGQLLTDVAMGNVSPISQPAESPTQMAGRLTKTDSFVPWSVLRAAQTQDPSWLEKAQSDLAAVVATVTAQTDNKPTTMPYLYTLLQKQEVTNWPAILTRAARAFSPWPKLWTLAPTPKGDQRLIILEAEVKESKLELPSIQLEGKTAASWAQLKTAFVL